LQNALASHGAFFLYASLFVVGLAASTFGSIVGLGGGFLMVPALRLLYGLNPAMAAGTSLLLVVANSASGSIAYLRKGQVDIRLGLMIAAGALPGSIVGALLVAHVSDVLFDTLYAIFLIALAFDITVNREKRLRSRKIEPDPNRRHAMRTGYSVLTGFFVGLVSSMFGIGGGVVVVPVLLYFSTLPAHAISATSHFAIVLTSPVGLATHGLQHDVLLSYAIPLVAGGIAGGQIGARLSLRLDHEKLLKFVAFALTLAAVALAVRHFT
jgi:hypothetical protein